MSVSVLSLHLLTTDGGHALSSDWISTTHTYVLIMMMMMMMMTTTTIDELCFPLLMIMVM
jgi:hypothetical protein